ncbi:hypothetical protein KL949_002179 [Ogataea haglerorum]|nr:hypothetical protein KL913_001959 [Ogataea haglerorum]KAG7720214.1 hypothetical protein KL949_002179 [Ogataea haglerorum]KAG7768669.1 hypothetical protein KL931_003275 [Ogataea haglerorum]
MPPASMLQMPDSDQQANWADLVKAHVLVVKAFLVDSDLEAALEQAINMVLSLVRIAQKEDGWICLPLMTATSELRQLGCMYWNMKNGEITLKNDTVPLDERLVDVLQKPFKTCLTDKSDTLARSKKQYVYFFANEVLRCYFKFAKYEAASNLSKVLSKAPNLPALDRSPKSHLVNFHYYNGLRQAAAAHTPGAAARQVPHRKATAWNRALDAVPATAGVLQPVPQPQGGRSGRLRRGIGGAAGPAAQKTALLHLPAAAAVCRAAAGPQGLRRDTEPPAAAGGPEARIRAERGPCVRAGRGREPARTPDRAGPRQGLHLARQQGGRPEQAAAVSKSGYPDIEETRCSLNEILRICKYNK